MKRVQILMLALYEQYRVLVTQLAVPGDELQVKMVWVTCSTEFVDTTIGVWKDNCHGSGLGAGL